MKDGNRVELLGFKSKLDELLDGLGDFVKEDFGGTTKTELKRR